MTSNRWDFICIGASAGGIVTVQALLLGLGKKFSIPMGIVQHIPEHSDLPLEAIFQPHYKGLVVEATDKTPIQQGHCYFAPSGYHLLVEKDKTFSLSQDEPVNFSRPSIDVFFETAAEAYGRRLCGVLLTGANQDGAAGLRYIQRCGGYTIVQDPEDAEFPQMPLEALKLMRPDKVLTLKGLLDAVGGHDA